MIWRTVPIDTTNAYYAEKLDFTKNWDKGNDIGLVSYGQNCVKK